MHWGTIRNGDIKMTQKGENSGGDIKDTLVNSDYDNTLENNKVDGLDVMRKRMINVFEQVNYDCKDGCPYGVEEGGYEGMIVDGIIDILDLNMRDAVNYSKGRISVDSLLEERLERALKAEKDYHNVVYLSNNRIEILEKERDVLKNRLKISVTERDILKQFYADNKNTITRAVDLLKRWQVFLDNDQSPSFFLLMETDAFFADHDKRGE